jgi:hypothetical protein
MSGSIERNERGGWHDGIINSLPFHIEIRGSQVYERTRGWYDIGSRAGAVRAPARVRNGASGLDARRKVPPVRGGTWATCDFLTRLQI